MKYKTHDNKAAGRIIAKERAKLRGFDGKSMSQQDFIEFLSDNYDVHIGRNTLSDAEHGAIEKLSALVLAAMCDAFGCDIDYLFGIIKGKTHEAQIAADFTHLSKEAIAALHEMGDTNINSKTISKLIADSFEPIDRVKSDENNKGLFLLRQICNYLNTPRTKAKLGYYSNGIVALVDEEGNLGTPIRIQSQNPAIIENDIDRLLAQVQLNDIQEGLRNQRKVMWGVK